MCAEGVPRETAALRINLRLEHGRVLLCPAADARRGHLQPAGAVLDGAQHPLQQRPAHLEAQARAALLVRQLQPVLPEHPLGKMLRRRGPVSGAVRGGAGPGARTMRTPITSAEPQAHGLRLPSEPGTQKGTS